VATHLGQPPSNLVSLIGFNSNPNDPYDITNFQRAYPVNGTRDFSIPANMALILTDIEFNYASTVANASFRFHFAVVDSSNLANIILAAHTAADSLGAGGGTINMTSGLLIPNDTTLLAGFVPNLGGPVPFPRAIVTLQGYLIKFP
jgi:hypothetical protein